MKTSTEQFHFCSINIFIIQLFIFIPFISFTQISIDLGDMPQQGDTIRTSTTIDLDGIDFEESGSDFTWDFSSLGYQVQQVDSFVSTTSTPLFYQVVFNPLVSNLAKKGGDFSLIPNFTVSDIYQYYKSESEVYKEVGIGVTLEGVPFPMKYSSDDIIYNLPLTYGDEDSSTAIFEFSFPGLGFIGIEKKRINIVDGYGTITTPLGQFDVIRVHSMIQEYDTAYIDSIGSGFGITRNYEEFKWLAKDMGIPVMSVFREGLVVTATYQDIYRPLFSVNEPVNYLDDIYIYPNPVDEKIIIYCKAVSSLSVDADLLAPDGRIVEDFGLIKLPKGESTKELFFNKELPSGIYILKLTGHNAQAHQKLIVK